MIIPSEIRLQLVVDLDKSALLYPPRALQFETTHNEQSTYMSHIVSLLGMVLGAIKGDCKV